MGAIVGLICLWAMYVSHTTRIFRDELKSGETCKFYIGEDKHRGTIITVDKKLKGVEIKPFMEPGDKTIWRKIEEIYP